jgi:hypothetical protein
VGCRDADVALLGRLRFEGGLDFDSSQQFDGELFLEQFLLYVKFISLLLEMLSTAFTFNFKRRGNNQMSKDRPLPLSNPKQRSWFINFAVRSLILLIFGGTFSFFIQYAVER